MKTLDQRVSSIEKKCKLVRKYTMEMTLEVEGGVHFGPAYSLIDIVGTLYFDIMNFDTKNPRWEDRDRFILSKGHGCAGLYPALAMSGFFPVEELKNYGAEGGFLGMHPGMDVEHGIEASTGSLGQGLSIGAGIALAGKISKKDYRTFVVLGNGECQEGQIWECALSSAQYGLDNLVAIIDDNGMQCDHESRTICDMGDFAAKWKAFGWHTIEVDGHDVRALLRAFSINSMPFGKPLAVICKTVKGKGISFCENNNDWHHTHYVTKEIVDRAMVDLVCD
jgi:transketolase